jgi:hypothetical protein
MALYVKFAEEKRPATVRVFIKKFYSKKCFDFLKGMETFKDKKCQNSHCIRSYRSFDDLKELINTYYPSITAVKLMEYLLTTNFESEGKKFYPHLGTCSTMKRIRFIPFTISSYSSLDVKMKLSKFTWNDLLHKLDIKNGDQFEKYIKNRK